MKPKTNGIPEIRSKVGGFTLVEILVVVGILALLAGLIFPAFSRARNSARTANCASNLKQIGLAFKLYVGDNRGFHPPLIILDRPDCSWPEQIYPYAKSTAIFSCPSDEFGEFRVGCPPTTIDAPLPKWDGSYDLNSLPRRLGRKAFNEARLRNPSATILFCDGKGNAANFSSEQDNTWSNGVPISPRDFTDLGDRHNYGSNVAYADGHVKWRSHEDLFDVKQWKP